MFGGVGGERVFWILCCRHFVEEAKKHVHAPPPKKQITYLVHVVEEQRRGRAEGAAVVDAEVEADGLWFIYVFMLMVVVGGSFIMIIAIHHHHHLTMIINHDLPCGGPCPAGPEFSQGQSAPIGVVVCRRDQLGWPTTTSCTHTSGPHAMDARRIQSIPPSVIKHTHADTPSGGVRAFTKAHPPSLSHLARRLVPAPLDPHIGQARPLGVLGALPMYRGRWCG